MFCLDWEREDIEIYGNEKNAEYSRLEVVLVPCNYVHKEYGDVSDTVH